MMMIRKTMVVDENPKHRSKILVLMGEESQFGGSFYLIAVCSMS